MSVVSLTAVVWWALRQPAPEFPGSASALAWLTLSLVMSLGALALRGWRWHRIMVLAYISHDRSDAYGLTAVGYMGNNVLPARGGEVLKIAILGSRSDSRRREILGSVLTERLLDAVVLAALFVVLTVLTPAASVTGAGTAALAGGCLALGFGSLAIYVRLRRRSRFERFAARVHPVAKASRLLTHRGGIPVIAVTAAIWVLEGANLVVIARSVELDLALADGVFVVTLASLAAAVPVAPGYAGTFDAAMVLGLKAAGIAGGAAVTLLLLSRFMYFVPATAVGLIAVVTRYGGLKLARKRLAAAQRGHREATSGGLDRSPADHQELLAEQPPCEPGIQIRPGQARPGREPTPE